MCCSPSPAIRGYGQLSGRSQEELLAGARIEVAPYKRDPGDFVLWKPSTRRPAGLGQPVGPRPARLAYRMLRHVLEIPGRDASTSTAAAAT